MPENDARPAASCSWSKVVRLFLVLQLLVLLAPVAPATVLAAQAPAPLLALASTSPQANVSIIVQKWGHSSGPEQLINRFGGTVTGEFGIIDGFAATVPARALPALAAMPGVRWVSPDAPLQPESCDQCINTGALASRYVQAIAADRLWNSAPYLQGQGVAVAVVDTGIAGHTDLGQGARSRVIASAEFVPGTTTGDNYGHGTHVAGIIGGNGTASRGQYIGVAPKVNLVNVKVGNGQGAGSVADVIEGLQWVYDHHTAYNIRVVNLSLHSSTAEPYQTSPLDAAVEVLWLSRVVVVVAAGNSAGNGILYPPANDPFVITVGAMDDHGTSSTADDTLAPFSAYGTTESGFAKPDLAAPGTNIISLLADHNEVLARQHRDHIVDASPQSQDDYFRMSGTSMSAAVAAGAVALLVQSNPQLTPDQIKYRLKSTAHPVAGRGAGAGALDIAAAVRSRATNSDNGGVRLNRILWPSNTPVVWSSLNWESLNWESLNWESLNWESVNWESLNWESLNWDSIDWDQ